MPLLPACILGMHSSCTLERLLRSFQCRYCYWEFSVGKDELHIVFIECEVFAYLQILGLKKEGK